MKTGNQGFIPLPSRPRRYSAKTAIRPDPDRPAQVRRNCRNQIAGNRRGIERRRVVTDEPVLLEDVPVEPSRKGPHPDDTARVLMNTGDLVVTQTVLIGWVAAQYRERVPVIQIEPVFGTEPEKPSCILDDADNDALGETLINGYSVEHEWRYLTRSRKDLNKDEEEQHRPGIGAVPVEADGSGIRRGYHAVHA